MRPSQIQRLTRPSCTVQQLGRLSRPWMDRKGKMFLHILKKVLSTVQICTYEKEKLLISKLDMKSIDNDPFEISYMQYNDLKYKQSLDCKIDTLMNKFNENQFILELIKGFGGDLEVVESPVKHLRQRCRFAIIKSTKLDVFNSVNDVESASTHLSYALWEFGGPNITVDSFPIASSQIFNVMPILLKFVEIEKELCDDLRAVNFLSTSVGDLMITLVYERHLDSVLWTPHGEVLRESLLSKEIDTIRNISIIGRSKGVKLVVGAAWVTETLTLRDGRTLHYKQVDEGFSNPNSSVNAKVLDWLCDSAAIIHSSSSSSFSNTLDLLEMYCGNGNHTVALAGCFRRVLAVELNKALCVAAEENFAMNNVTNAQVVACNSNKFATQILRNKDHYHAQSSSSSDSSTTLPFEFSAVLVDPPRSGLDATTCRLVAQYPHILYISCQPDSLIRDLQQLSSTHTLVRLAAFDHFAYTPHLECGVLLRRREVSHCLS